MIPFVVTVFAVYGSVHVYAFIRARSVLAFGLLTGTGIAAFMLFMVSGIFLIRWLETREYETAAQVLSFIAYLWMAALFLFFCCSLVFDLIALLTRIAGWLARTDISAYVIPSKTSFLLSLAIALLICLYGYFEARGIRIERLVVETAKLPAGTDKMTIVQISDVHLGLINRSSRLEPMIRLVKDSNPDMFVVTGDLVDAQINHLTGLAEMIRAVPAPLGKFAIMGNHEYYAGTDKSLAFIRDAGLRLLRDEAALAGPIMVVGADDHTSVQLKLGSTRPGKDLLSAAQGERFILYLKHRPHIDTATVGLFDLQLSGHTHKGQIFPFVHLTRMTFPFVAGRYDLGNGSLLYVNRGTGTWGPPIRFLAPPEVTVIDLVRKKPS